DASSLIVSDFFMGYLLGQSPQNSEEVFEFPHVGDMFAPERTGSVTVSPIGTAALPAILSWIADSVDHRGDVAVALDLFELHRPARARQDGEDIEEALAGVILDLDGD